MPLFREGAAIIERWSEGFESWMSNGGLQRLVNYAEAELPRVATTLENLSSDAVTLAADLAPVGDAIMDIANGVHGLSELEQSLDGATDSGNAFGTVLGSAWEGMQSAVNPISNVTGLFARFQPAIDKATGATKENTAASKDSTSAAEQEKRRCGARSRVPTACSSVRVRLSGWCRAEVRGPG